MSAADLRRRRQARRAERDRRRDDRRQQRRAAPTPTEPRPLPDERTFLEEFCWWPDETSGKPVRGLSDLQRDCLDKSAAFKVDAEGNRIGGSDCCRKPRKVRFTTLYLGRIFYALIRAWLERGEAWSATSAFEVEKPAKLAPIRRRALFMLSRLPKEWTGGMGVTGNTVGTRGRDGWNGWTWTLVSAGAGLASADIVGRGDTQHIVHLSESRKYRHYDATIASLVGSQPSDGSGWLVDETTFAAERAHPSTEVYFATLEGRSRFTTALFWPWYADPNKRLPRGSPDYRRMMARGFPLSTDDKEAEDRLGLDREQRAFRRLHRCTGTLEQQREARANYPETEAEVFRGSAKLVYDERALMALDAQTKGVQLLSVESPHAPDFVAAVYALPQPGEVVVVGLDPAEFGRDKTSGSARERASWEQFAVLDGNALDSEVADTLVWLAVRLGVGESHRNAEGLLCLRNTRGRYWVAVERQKGLKVIRECERRGVPLWCEPGTKRPGFSTSDRSRPRIFDAVKELVHGPSMDEEGHYREPRPVAITRDAGFAAELWHIVWLEGRPDHEQGHRSDKVVANGIAVEAARSVESGVGVSLADWMAAQRSTGPAPASRYSPPV